MKPSNLNLPAYNLTDNNTYLIKGVLSVEIITKAYMSIAFQGIKPTIVIMSDELIKSMCELYASDLSKEPSNQQQGTYKLMNSTVEINNNLSNDIMIIQNPILGRYFTDLPTIKYNVILLFTNL